MYIHIYIYIYVCISGYIIYFYIYIYTHIYVYDVYVYRVCKGIMTFVNEGQGLRLRHDMGLFAPESPKDADAFLSSFGWGLIRLEKNVPELPRRQG